MRLPSFRLGWSESIIIFFMQIFLNSLAPFLTEKYAGINSQTRNNQVPEIIYESMSPRQSNVSLEESPSAQPRNNQVPEIIYESVSPRESNVSLEDSPSEQPRNSQVPEATYESVSPRESNVSLEEYGVRLEENISYGEITAL